MRIISKFKDYYDNVQYANIDTDPKLVYVRETKEVDNKLLNHFACGNIAYNINYRFFIDTFYVGFCGKVYPGLQLEMFKEIKHFYSFESLISYIANFDDAKLNCQQNISNKVTKRIKNEIIEDVNKYIHSYHNIEKFGEGINIGVDTFEKHNTPIILIKGKWGSRKVYINSNLGMVNFGAMFDAYSCYQEIMMFLGNDLAKQIDPTTNFTDEMKRDIAGFDEWSFKKPGKNSKM